MATEDKLESMEFTFEELLEKITETDDLIITIPSEELDSLRVGLAQTKNRINAQFKKQDIPVDTRRLNVEKLAEKEVNGAACIEVRLRFVAKKGVTIMDMKTPSEF